MRNRHFLVISTICVHNRDVKLTFFSHFHHVRVLSRFPKHNILTFLCTSNLEEKVADEVGGGLFDHRHDINNTMRRGLSQGQWTEYSHTSKYNHKHGKHTHSHRTTHQLRSSRSQVTQKHIHTTHKHIHTQTTHTTHPHTHIYMHRQSYTCTKRQYAPNTTTRII